MRVSFSSAVSSSFPPSVPTWSRISHGIYWAIKFGDLFIGAAVNRIENCRGSRLPAHFLDDDEWKKKKRNGNFYFCSHWFLKTSSTWGDVTTAPDASHVRGLKISGRRKCQAVIHDVKYRYQSRPSKTKTKSPPRAPLHH